MFFYAKPSALLDRQTQSQSKIQASISSTYRAAVMAGHIAPSKPSAVLPYYEDCYGTANPDEDRCPHHCESETDDGVNCGKEIEESSEIDSDSGSESKEDNLDKIGEIGQHGEEKSKGVKRNGDGNPKQNEKCNFDFKKYCARIDLTSSSGDEMNGTAFKGP